MKTEAKACHRTPTHQILRLIRNCRFWKMTSMTRSGGCSPALLLGRRCARSQIYVRLTRTRSRCLQALRNLVPCTNSFLPTTAKAMMLGRPTLHHCGSQPELFCTQTTWLPGNRPISAYHISFTIARPILAVPLRMSRTTSRTKSSKSRTTSVTSHNNSETWLMPIFAAAFEQHCKGRLSRPGSRQSTTESTTRSEFRSGRAC
jgi:hypothetical protein